MFYFESMSFEIRGRDVLGKIGRLTTKSGVVETPAFIPVIDPINQVISPKIMQIEFGCDIVITNSYLIKRRHGKILDLGIHNFLDYDGVIMTDSGAYQILVYGDIEVAPEEIVDYQIQIGSDIAVILDIPTGWKESRSKVEWTVKETIRRAEAALPLIVNTDILWVGPVQGGAHLDLVASSANSIASMPYQIHALGSPTEVMESYRFPLLVDMIMTAKRNLPVDRPLHLFGAGHPMMFSLAIALGSDMFDSAAYAIYAKNGRYITPLGTKRLEELRYFPCSCPVCKRYEPDELKEMLKGERVRTLTEHNLHVCMSEIDRIKQAIIEGALWDLMESRSRGHPALASAVKRLIKYQDELEKGSPSYNKHGFFFFDYGGLARPEITRHMRRLETNYSPPIGSEKLLLVASPSRKPYSKSIEHQCLLDALNKGLGGVSFTIHICYYSAPFGVIPIELSETYPLSQFETSKPLDHETLEFTSNAVSKYVRESFYKEIFLLSDISTFDKMVEEKCKEACLNSGKPFLTISDHKPWNKDVLKHLILNLKGT